MKTTKKDVLNELIGFRKVNKYRKMVNFFIEYAIDDIEHDYNKFNNGQTLYNFIHEFLEREIKLEKLNHGSDFERAF